MDDCSDEDVADLHDDVGYVVTSYEELVRNHVVNDTSVNFVLAYGISLRL